MSKRSIILILLFSIICFIISIFDNRETNRDRCKALKKSSVVINHKKPELNPNPNPKPEPEPTKIYNKSFNKKHIKKIPLTFLEFEKIFCNYNEVIYYLNIIYKPLNIFFYTAKVKTTPSLGNKGNLLYNLKRMINIKKKGIVVGVCSSHQGDKIGYAPLGGGIDNEKAKCIVDFKAAANNRVRATLLGHEIGHLLGLKHNSIPRSVMYPTVTNYTSVFTEPEINIIKIKQ